MAIVITDGKYYFKPGNKYARTQNTEEAATFPKREDAIQFMWNDVDETKFFLCLRYGNTRKFMAVDQPGRSSEDDES